MNSIVPIVPIILVGGLYYAESASASTWSLAHFTRYVAAMVRRNLPLGSSLSAYAQDLPGWRFGKRKVLLDIADTVDNGMFFADALDRHPAVFPGYYRALIRAGENGGNLDAVLEHLAQTADASGRTTRVALGYTVYPAFLSAVVLTVASVAFGRMLQLFSEMCYPEGPSPASFLLPAYHLAVLAFVLFTGAAFWLLLVPLIPWRPAAQIPMLASVRSWLTWHLPLVRRYERRQAVSQYALVAGRLMEAGVPTHEALEIASRASGNSHFDNMARSAAGGVAEGGKLSAALRSADPYSEIPSEFVWYVEVGEASGKLPAALLKESESAAARSRSALSRLVGLVFPAGIILIAVIVGMMGYAMFGSLVALMEGML